jgi:VIT1/CCC1 family predicted Fe2+/Mn2+ transporter
MEYTNIDLKNHLKNDHVTSPLAEYLKEIVYGGNDGIVTTFAVVAGFIGAQQGSNIIPAGYMTVLLFGLANLFADGTSMGLGNFLSIRSEQDQYKKERQIELSHMETQKEIELAQTRLLLENEGFEKEQARTLANIFSTNKKYWADFMMTYELKMAEPSENPILSGVATLLSFIIFGTIPLVPFIFMDSSQNAFYFAIGATISALFLLGLLRWRVTKLSMFRSIGEIILIGGLSASIAYIVGTFFKG